MSALTEFVASLSEEDWCAEQLGTQLSEHLDAILLVDEERSDPRLDSAGLTTALQPILARLGSAFGPGFPKLVSLVRLRAGDTIPLHRDGPAQCPQMIPRRVHIALQTNPEVAFEVGGECRHLGTGAITEINEWRPHTVSNRGARHRIHLVIDWLSFAPPAA